MTNLYTDKRTLVTGGLGFIGSNLAIRLVKLGADVEIFDALIPDMGGNKFNIEPVKKDVKVTIGDLRDEGKIAKAVRGKDIIFNLAGTLSHIDSMENPFSDLDINCRAQLQLLEACKKLNRGVKIIYAGTRNQYGKAKYLPVDENHPLEPTDINGVNAIAGEKYHLMYDKVYGIGAVSLRMTNTFGPRHQMKHSKQGVLNWFLRQIIDGETIKLMGGGGQIRDINYIDDVVRALILAGASKNANGQVYNLGGSALSLLEFSKKAINILGRGNTRNIDFPKDRKNIEVGDYIADYKKITKDLGWEPKTSIDEAIKKTFGYYKRYKKYYW
ncbi:MAG: GDP-mannose 4,6-dehydratase [Candidatus Curtissbacteria bacterium]|nr:GDP-mannose 4,6-dehydratase [Candidatus Curtissbacteria bacterium]